MALYTSPVTIAVIQPNAMLPTTPAIQAAAVLDELVENRASHPCANGTFGR